MPDTHIQPPVAPAIASMDDFLSDYARKNPDLAWVTQMLAAQRQRSVTVTDLPDVDALRSEIDALRSDLAQTQARADKLSRYARRLSDELEDAHVMLGDLAAAFGACGLCWGADPRCRSCRGRGKPGRFAPDPELRARFFVEPVALPEASRASTPLDQPERR